MRNAWKALSSVRSLAGAAAASPRGSRIQHPDLCFRPSVRQDPKFLLPLAGCNSGTRCLSSAPTICPKVGGEASSKPIGSDVIKHALESLGLSLDQKAVDVLLKELKSTHFAADGELFRFNSLGYNQMLRSLCATGRSEALRRLVEIMRKNGFRIYKDTVSQVSKIAGVAKKDVDLLQESYSLGADGNEDERICREICKIFKEGESAEAIRSKLHDVNAKFSSDLIVKIVQRISQQQPKSESFPQNAKKALLLLQWVEEGQALKIDCRVYNVMAGILSRADCADDFRAHLHKMKTLGYKLERETYVEASDRFLKFGIIHVAVDLYEFAMGGFCSEKPPAKDFLLLLKKVVVSKSLDTDLVTRVVRTFINDGNSIKASVFSGVLKSLTSVGRLGKCAEILQAMEKGGFAPDSSIHDTIVIGLCDSRHLNEALEYLDNIEKEGYSLDPKTWVYLVQKHCQVGELDKGVKCLHKMIERRGGAKVGRALEVLVKGFCDKDKAKDANKILREVVTKRNAQPWHSTYKLLIEKLVNQGCVKEASSIFGLMKGHGFPPFIEPFIGHVSKSGTVDDALCFLKAMTVKDFPSKTVYIRLFETLLKAGRYDVAHGVLSKSPGCVRNHADVLDLFYSMKCEEAATAVVA